MAPTSATGLLIFLLFVVPGFVYQAVRISVRGRLPFDLELSTRIVRAIVTSGIFGLVYCIILGNELVKAAHGTGYGFEHPRIGAALALLGGIVIPAGLALIPAPEWDWLTALRGNWPQITKYDFTPTAWDRAFQSAEECFIRVLTNDDRWIAGYYGSASYATSYPEPTSCSWRRHTRSPRTAPSETRSKAHEGSSWTAPRYSLLQVLSGAETEGDGPNE